MKRIFAFVFAVLTFSILLSCTQQEQEVSVSSVTLSQPTAEMIIGETLTLKATISPTNATDKQITWASSKQSVASIDQSGKVEALTEGVSIITAVAGGKTGSCAITVSKGYITVESLELDNQELTLVEGDEFLLKATVKPDDATERTVTWSSSDSKVVTVDDSGKVKAIKEGEAAITAKAGEKSAECKVTVSAKKIDVTMVMLSKTSLSMIVGEEFTLTATIEPDDATEKTIVWHSSDNNVATVSNPGGVVHAVKEGSALIYASADGQEASCRVTVDYHRVSDIELSTESTTLYPSETTIISAMVIPSNATYPELSWSSSNNEIAVVDGGKVTAVNPGKVTITASNRDIQKQIEITILVPLLSVSLDRSSASMFEGTDLTLHATLNPSYADLRDPLTWSSSNIDVATVDNDGVVSAIKPGVAVIKVTADGKTADCIVSVTIPGNGNEDTVEEIWK